MNANQSVHFQHLPRSTIHQGCEFSFGITESLRKSSSDLSDTEIASRRRLVAEWRSKHCWSPNQLRHTAGTEMRKRFGAEAAQTVLGHSHLTVTEIYAERDLAKAADVIRVLSDRTSIFGVGTTTRECNAYDGKRVNASL